MVTQTQLHRMGLNPFYASMLISRWGWRKRKREVWTKHYPSILRLLVTILFTGNVRWSYKTKLVPVSSIGMFFEFHRRVGSRSWSVWRSLSWISGGLGLFSISFWSRWRWRWGTSATEHHGTGRRCFGHYNMVTRPNTYKVRNNGVTWSIIHSQNVLN